MNGSWCKDAITAAIYAAPRQSLVPRPDSIISQRPGWAQIRTPSSSNTYLNEVFESVVPGPLASQVVAETLSEYGGALKWSVGPWPGSAELSEELANAGAERIPTRAMYLSPAAQESSTPENIKVSLVRDADAKDFCDIFEEVFGVAFVEGTRSTAVTRYFLARLGDQPAGIAAVRYLGAMAYFIAGAVRKPLRGKGVYRALLAARLDELRSRGIGLAVIHAVEASSAPILERLGWQTSLRYDVFKVAKA
jgi:GNAT superfamily N-acetyltransferase